jgi:hypothetical protein
MEHVMEHGTEHVRFGAIVIFESRHKDSASIQGEALAKLRDLKPVQWT